MNDFFADLEKDLLDATSRANERRRRWLPTPPPLPLGPVVAFAATAAIIVAVVGIAGVLDGSDERSAVQEQNAEPGFDHEKGTKRACADPRTVLETFAVLRRDPTDDERAKGDRIARAFDDREPLAGGARLAQATPDHEYWIVPVGCAGRLEQFAEPGVCLRRTGERELAGCFSLGHSQGGAGVGDGHGMFFPVPDGVAGVTVDMKRDGKKVRVQPEGNVGTVEYTASEIKNGVRAHGATFQRGGGLIPVDKGEGCTFTYKPEETERAAAEVFSVFAREQTRDDATMPAVDPQGDLQAYDPSGTRFLGAGQGHKYYAFAGLVGECEDPRDGVCLTAASLDDTVFVCETLAAARREGVRMLANPDYLIGLAPGDAKQAIVADIGEFAVRDSFYRGSIGEAGERALSAPVRFE